MNYKIIGLIVLLGCFSCAKVKTIDSVLSSTANDSLIVSQKITTSVGVLLDEEARLKVATWKEYQQVATLITELYNTSKSDVLENATMYADEIKQLRDSIRIKELDNPKIISRLNVLLTQSLRLKDMNKIPSISDQEVKDEAVKLCESFSSLNSRINTFYKTIQLEKELDQFSF